MTDDKSPGDPRDDDTGPHGTVIQLERPRPRATFDPGEPPSSSSSGSGDSGENPAAGDVDEKVVVIGAVDVDVDELHPRLAQRRDEIASATEHRRTIRRIWVLAPIALVVNGLALAHSPFLDVDRVVAVESEHVSAAAIAAASGVDRGDSLVTLNDEAAEAHIERLAWVADAEVVRRWDGTVEMRVQERQPAAVVQTRDDLPQAVVDQEGRVLEIGGSVPPGLVLVTGVGDGLAEGAVVPARARDALRIALDVPRRVPGAVASVSTDLEARLVAGGVVRFGSAAALDEKMVALATVLAQVDMTNVAVLDLGVPDNPTVTRH